MLKIIQIYIWPWPLTLKRSRQGQMVITVKFLIFCLYGLHTLFSLIWLLDDAIWPLLIAHHVSWNGENGCHGNQYYIWNNFVKIGALYQNQYRMCIWTFGGSMVIFSQSAHTFSLSCRLLCPGSLVLCLPYCPQMVKAHIKAFCQLKNFYVPN